MTWTAPEAPAPSGPVRGADRVAERQLREEIRGELSRLLSDRQLIAPRADDAERIRTLIHDHVEDYGRRAAARNAPELVDSAAVERRLFDGLLRLGALQPLMDAPDVEEILVNGATRVFTIRGGSKRLEPDVYFDDEEELLQLVKRLIGPLGKRLDESSPMVDARLPDGSRLNAAIPPATVGGCSVSIRKFLLRAHSLEQLVRLGTLPDNAAQFLAAAVRGGVNILVSGPTGAGKTTFVNALGDAITSPEERVVTIEEVAELQLRHQLRDCIALQARAGNVEGVGEIRIRDLVRNALRMRPTRIVVGEVRGAEALDMLLAMNTGHEGRLTGDARVHFTSGTRRVGEFVDALMAEFPARVVVRNETTGPVEYLPIPGERPVSVTSVTASGRAEATPVLYALRSRYRGIMLRLRTASGLVHTVSPEHPLYALRDAVDYVPASGLTVGDWLAAPRRIVWEHPAAEGEASYWAGMLTGDGCITGSRGPHGRRAQSVWLRVDDAHIARSFGSHLMEEFGAPRASYRGGPGAKVHTLVCNSSRTAKLVASRYALPVGARSRETRLEWTADSRSPRHFLAGFFDAEGHVGMAERGTRDVLTISSCNTEYLAFAREALLSEGIPSRLRRMHASRSDLPTWGLVVTGRDPIQRFGERIPLRHAGKRASLDALRRRLSGASANPNADVIPCTVRLARYLRRAEALGISQRAIASRAGCSQSLISAYARGLRHPTPTSLARLCDALEAYGIPCGDLEVLAHADLRWERIVSVEPVEYDGYAYDLQVAEDRLSGTLPHNFAADCLLTSNSLTTIHGSTPRDALERLATLAMMAEERLSGEALTRMVARTIELVVQLRFEPMTGRRRLATIFEVTGTDGDVLTGNELWTLDPDSGRLRWTGIPPRCLGKIAARGIAYAPPPAPAHLEARAGREGRDSRESRAA